MCGNGKINAQSKIKVRDIVLIVLHTSTIINKNQQTDKFLS